MNLKENNFKEKFEILITKISLRHGYNFSEIISKYAEGFFSGMEKWYSPKFSKNIFGLCCVYCFLEKEEFDAHISEEKMERFLEIFKENGFSYEDIKNESFKMFFLEKSKKEFYTPLREKGKEIAFSVNTAPNFDKTICRKLLIRKDVFVPIDECKNYLSHSEDMNDQTFWEVLFSLEKIRNAAGDDYADEILSKYGFFSFPLEY